MKTRQFTLDLNDELIIDNFAGGGGASTGIEMALGRYVDIAINHDPEALALHQENHPQTLHLREDVFAVDPVEVCRGRPVGLAWFSPDCKHFSKAKGGKPRSKKIRGLAWVAVKWAKAVRPRVIFLENVEEFKTWGPLLKCGQPCPRRKGRTFESFIGQLEALGYRVEYRELRACDYGAPTIRKRLFLIARCDESPIVWPAQTHGDPDSVEVRSRKLKPWRTAAECINWRLPCHSIFLTKDEARPLGVRRPLADATMRRIARGIRKFVLDSPNPFIVPCGSPESNDETAPCLFNVANSKTTGRGPNAWPVTSLLRTVTASPGFALAEASLAPLITEHANASSPRSMAANEPLRTQCAETKGGHFAQVTAFLSKNFGGEFTHASAMEKPVPTVTATDHNALVSAHLKRDFGKSVGHSAESPSATVTAGAGGHGSLVATHLSKLYGTTTGHPASEPLHTVTGAGQHLAEVRAFLLKYYGTNTGQSAADPCHTVTATDRLGIVVVNGEDYMITDIGMRMLSPRELYNAQGFPSDYLITPVHRGKPLSKSAQVRMAGNSVCPPLAAALVAANLSELRIVKSQAA